MLWQLQILRKGTHSQQQEIIQRRSGQMANLHQGTVGSKQQVCWQRSRSQHQELSWQQAESISGKSGNKLREPSTSTKVQLYEMTQVAKQHHSAGGLWNNRQGPQDFLKSLELGFKIEFFFPKEDDRQSTKAIWPTRHCNGESFPSVRVLSTWDQDWPKLKMEFSCQMRLKQPNSLIKTEEPIIWLPKWPLVIKDEEGRRINRVWRP